MNDEKNTITYDEDWKSVTDTEYPQTVHADFDNEDIEESENHISDSNIKKKNKKDSPKQLLITFQIILCLLIALIAFVLKSIGGELYETVHNWYYTELNNSAVFDNNDFNLSSFFEQATKDEV